MTAKKSKSQTTKLSTETVIADLKRLATKKTLEGMARYAIPSARAFGVTVGDLKKYAKKVGRSHELAEALWKTGWYEARMLAAMIDDPKRVSPAQMDRWCQGFDSWAICDTVCFHLFDRTPHAFVKVREWAGRAAEFEKRAAFALLWSLSVHDKTSGDEPFLEGLQLIELAADDDRNFVKKGINMALRAIGKRNAALHLAAIETAQRLSQSHLPSARWIGKDALRELASPKTAGKFARIRTRKKVEN